MEQIKDNKLLQRIALVFKELRGDAELSQEEVFNHTNIHIGRIESGKANISVSTLSSLCKYFKIPMSQFIKRVEER